MKPQKFFVQGRYTSTYRLHRSYEAPVFGPIRAENLSNEHDAMEFIRRLRMDHADWLRLLHEMNALTANSDRSLYYSQRDVATLASGYHPRIHFYRFDARTYDFDNTDNHYPVINTTPGVTYHFVPSSILLLSDPDPEDIHCFTLHEVQQAEQFLDSLALTDEQLASIIPGLTLRFGLKAYPGPTRKERFDCLRNALLGGDIVAVRVEESITPPKRRGPEDLPVEEYTPKPYTLGLHEEPGYESNPHAGLHNQEELTPDHKTSAESFKPTKQVDMRNLSPEEDAARKALKKQGWEDKKIKQVLESGDNFTETSYQAGEKIYGFNTAGRGRDLDNSAYLLDEKGYQNVKKDYYRQGHWDKEGVKGHLALPCFNGASQIDVMEVTTSIAGIQSTIGKATELLRYDGADGYTTGTLGKIMGGGGKQITLDTSALKLLPKE